MIWLRSLAELTDGPSIVKSGGKNNYSTLKQVETTKLRSSTTDPTKPKTRNSQLTSHLNKPFIQNNLL